MKPTSQVRVLAETVAVAADVHDVTVMDEAVDQRRSHYLIPKDRAPIFKAFVAGEDRRGVLVAPGEELEEEHGAGRRDGQIADLVDDHDAREDERTESMREPAARLGVFERVQEIRSEERRVGKEGRS